MASLKRSVRFNTEPNVVLLNPNLKISNMTFDEKKNMWIQALLNKNNKNIFMTAHGDPYEGPNLEFIVPDNVILVFITPRSHVIFSDPADDLESLIYLKNPNWFKSDWNDKPDTCNGADVPTYGFSRPDPKNWNFEEAEEPEELVGFDDQVKFRAKEGLKKGTAQGARNILNYANVFFPGDSCYNQSITFEADSPDFNAFLLGQPYTKAEVSGSGGYRKLYHQQVVLNMAPYFNLTGKEKEASDASNDLLFQFYNNGRSIERPAISMPVVTGNLAGDLDEYPLKELEGANWSLAAISPDFNKDIVFQIEERSSQGDYQPRLNSTETFANYLSQVSKKYNNEPIIMYFNSCSPDYTRYTLAEKRDRGAASGKRLLEIQALRSDIQKIGRQNFCNLRKHISITSEPLSYFPAMMKDDLPRHTDGYARMTSDERHDWYSNHIGHFFKILRTDETKKSSSNMRKSSYIGLSSGDNWDAQKALDSIYEEAKMDQSGILLKRLFERYKGERIRHISKWLESKAQKKIKEIPIWREDWFPGRPLVVNQAVVGGKRKKTRRRKKRRRKRRRTRKKK